MTDPFAQMVAERYPRLARAYAEQLRLPVEGRDTPILKDEAQAA